MLSGLQRELGEVFFGLNRVVAGKAGQAERLFREARGADHAVQAQIAQAIQANEILYAFDRMLVSDQFTLG